MQQERKTLTPIFGIPPEKISSMVNRDVIEQHIEEVSFQWLQHVSAVSRPDYTLQDLTELDGYIDANLEGIYLGNEVTWEVCESLLDEDEEYIFPATILALRRNNPLWQKHVLETVNDDNVKSFIGALGWLTYSEVAPFLFELMASQKPFYQYIALSAYELHRQMPSVNLRELLKTDIPLLKNQVIRLIGILKCRDLRNELHPYLISEQHDYRFWSAWALALIGERVNVLPVLKEFLFLNSDHVQHALQIAFRIADYQEQREMIFELVANNEVSLAVIAMGIAGHIENIPKLIDIMHETESARLAGEAFSMITGVDIDYSDLILEERDTDNEIESFDDEEFDIEDDETEIDDYWLNEYQQDLPLPDPKLVSQWWQYYSHHYQKGVRYLNGELISEGNLYNILNNSFQRQRNAAALELALLLPENIFLEMRNRSGNQINLMVKTGELYG